MKSHEFTVFRTNHTSFTVSSLDDSIGFFCEALGFELLSRAPRDPDIVQQISGIKGADIEVAFIQGPGHRIELIQYHGPNDRSRVESRPCDTGFAHVAYDVDNVDQAINSSKIFSFFALGDPVSIDKGPNAGCRVVYLRNHDGITVEFIEKSE